MLTFDSVIAFFKKFTGGKKALLLISPILTILFPLQTALAGLALVITLDFITGIRKNLHVQSLPFNIFKAEFWRAFKSEGVRRTWKKSTEYGVGIIVLAVIEASFIGAPLITLADKAFTLTELGVLIATLIECYSIFENMIAVNPDSVALRYTKSLIPALKKLLLGKLAAVLKTDKKDAEE
jgi:hypothetical protein